MTHLTWLTEAVGEEEFVWPELPSDPALGDHTRVSSGGRRRTSASREHSSAGSSLRRTESAAVAQGLSKGSRDTAAAVQRQSSASLVHRAADPDAAIPLPSESSSEVTPPLSGRSSQGLPGGEGPPRASPGSLRVSSNGAAAAAAPKVQDQFQSGERLLELSSQVQSIQQQIGGSQALVHQLSSENKQLQRQISKAEEEKARRDADLEQLRRQNEQLQHTLSETLQQAATSMAAGSAAPAAAGSSSKTEKKLMRYSKQLQKDKSRLQQQVDQLLDSQAMLLEQLAVSPPSTTQRLTGDQEELGATRRSGTRRHSTGLGTTSAGVPRSTSPGPHFTSSDPELHHYPITDHQRHQQQQQQQGTASASTSPRLSVWERLNHFGTSNSRQRKEGPAAAADRRVGSPPRGGTSSFLSSATGRQSLSSTSRSAAAAPTSTASRHGVHTSSRSPRDVSPRAAGAAAAAAAAATAAAAAAAAAAAQSARATWSPSHSQSGSKAATGAWGSRTASKGTSGQASSAAKTSAPGSPSAAAGAAGEGPRSPTGYYLQLQQQLQEDLQVLEDQIHSIDEEPEAEEEQEVEEEEDEGALVDAGGHVHSVVEAAAAVPPPVSIGTSHHQQQQGSGWAYPVSNRKEHFKRTSIGSPTCGSPRPPPAAAAADVTTPLLQQQQQTQQLLVPAAVPEEAAAGTRRRGGGGRSRWHASESQRVALLGDLGRLMALPSSTDWAGDDVEVLDASVSQEQQKTIQEQQKVIAELTMQTEALRARCSSQEQAAGELAAVKVVLAEKEAEVEGLQARLQMAQQVARLSAKDAARVTSQSGQAVEALAQEVADLSEQLEATQAQVLAAQGLEGDSSRLQELQEEHEELKKRYAAMKEQVQALSGERGHLMQRLATATQQVSDLHEELGPAVLHGSPTKKRSTGLLGRLLPGGGKGFLLSSGSQKEEGWAPFPEPREQQQEGGEGQAAAGEQPGGLGRDMRELAELKEQHAALKAKYDALREEQSCLLSQHTEMTSQRSSLRQLQASAEDRAAAAQAQVYSLQAQLESVKQQHVGRLATVTNALAKEQEANRQLQADKESLEAALALVSEAPGKLSSLHQENAGLRTDLEEANERIKQLKEELTAADSKAVAAMVSAAIDPEQQADSAVRTTVLELQQLLLARASENARLSVAVAEMVVSQHLVTESLTAAIAAAGPLRTVPVAELQPLIRILEGGMGLEAAAAAVVPGVGRSVEHQRVVLLATELSEIQQEVERAEDLVAAAKLEGQAASERAALLGRQLLKAQEDVGDLQEQLLQRQELLLVAALKGDTKGGAIPSNWSQRAAVLVLGSENVALKQEAGRKAAAMRRMASRMQELQAAVLEQQRMAEVVQRNTQLMQEVTRLAADNGSLRAQLTAATEAGPAGAAAATPGSVATVQAAAAVAPLRLRPAAANSMLNPMFEPMSPVPADNNPGVHTDSTITTTSDINSVSTVPLSRSLGRSVGHSLHSAAAAALALESIDTEPPTGGLDTDSSLFTAGDPELRGSLGRGSLGGLGRGMPEGRSACLARGGLHTEPLPDTGAAKPRAAAAAAAAAALATTGHIDEPAFLDISFGGADPHDVMLARPRASLRGLLGGPQQQKEQQQQQPGDDSFKWSLPGPLASGEDPQSPRISLNSGLLKTGSLGSPRMFHSSLSSSQATQSILGTGASAGVPVAGSSGGAGAAGPGKEGSVTLPGASFSRTSLVASILQRQQQQQRESSSAAGEVGSSGARPPAGPTAVPAAAAAEGSSRSLQGSLSRSSLVNAVLQRHRSRTLSEKEGAAAAGPEVSSSLVSGRSSTSAAASDRAAIVAAVLQQHRGGARSESSEVPRASSSSGLGSPRGEASSGAASTSQGRSSLVAAVLQRHRMSSLSSTAPAGALSGKGPAGPAGKGSGRDSPSFAKAATVRGPMVAGLVAQHQELVERYSAGDGSSSPVVAEEARGRLLSPRLPKGVAAKVPGSLPGSLQRPLPLGASLAAKLARVSSKR